MARIYVKESGGRTDGGGSTPAAALDLDTAKDLVASGDELVFLPGTYLLETPLDYSGFPVFIYGDGQAYIDGNYELEYAFKLGSSSTISGIRFKNCKSPVQVVDGADQTLVIDCFDYVTQAIEGGSSFKTGLVTDCTLKNVTTERFGDGISILSGVAVKNCLSRAPLAFSGELVERFSDETMVLPSLPVAASQALREADFLEGEASLYLAATNTDVAQQRALFRKFYEVGERLDLSRADNLYVLCFGIDDSGIVSQSDAIRVELTSAGGSNTYNFAKTVFAAGYFLLQVDLANPDTVVGAIDLSDINEWSIDFLLSAGGSTIFQLDHAYLLDSSVEFLANGVPDESGDDPMAGFRGTGGIDVTATPPPYLNPADEDYRYLRSEANYLAYVRGGYNNFPLGALFNPAHFFSPEPPGDLGLTSHRILGSWVNDETFYDTTLDQPGPQGEGLAAVLDESVATVTAVNGEVVNLAQTTAAGETRDLDDAVGYKFDKNSGTMEWAGVRHTFVPALDTSADNPIGYSGEFKIPASAIPGLKPNGLLIVVCSGTGIITGRKLPADLVEGWNEVEVIIDDPDTIIGTHDPADIDYIEVRLSLSTSGSYTGFVVDHLKTLVEPGKSTAPADVDNNFFGIDLNNYPEGQVARVLGDPIPIRESGNFLYAFWSALESADDGAFINRRPFRQDHGTRTIEVRWAEMKFSRYGALQGALAQDWVPLSRLNPRSLPRNLDLLWVQPRVTIRNRTNEVE